ncbi:MAG: sulfur oxidation c-type cytochrome SoxX [Chromatiales bacterium]|nr:sulfur oxidation c-type cytochrome SoxX [Gammaproteobacteria bacterium]MBW6476371.1 sulfur oxidation c-type cytochrome SoxX [Chromatiales bacterium]
MMKKSRFAAGLAAVAAIALLAGCAGGTDTAASADAKPDYTKMTSKELADHLIFNGGFNLAHETQEGTTVAARMTQDNIQKMCTESRNKPTPEQVGKIVAEARASIKYPEGGIKLGDWKKGRDLAWSGFGYRAGHNNDNHASREVGANCYNCHQIGTDRTGGNFGPSLTGYGKTRGNTEGTRKFVYEVIYNAHSYFPCTIMPRMGYSGMLKEESISHVMAYLLDPESPVNK